MHDHSPIDLSKHVSFEVVKVTSLSETDLDSLSDIFNSVGMRAREKSMMQNAIAKSSDVFAAYAGDELIGFGRMVSDSVYYGTIWDLAVSMKYHHMGVGTEILSCLLKCAEKQGLLMVGLLTAEYNKSFYEKHGFEFHSDIYAMTRLQAAKDHI